jgi:hypothetical protein
MSVVKVSGINLNIPDKEAFSERMENRIQDLDLTVEKIYFGSSSHAGTQFKTAFIFVSPFYSL